MNRALTNAVRWVMDELIPPVIRDSKLFMWPFFCLAYRTMRPGAYMRFKTNVWSMTEADYAGFYRNLNSLSRNRKTDNNAACVERIVETCRTVGSVLDVGCGKGYLLGRIGSSNPRARLVGVDLLDDVPDRRFDYLKAPAHRLPFADGEFDVVLCTHVIEHLVEPDAVLAELVRVASQKVVVVTPKQRPYFYTLDEHVNFFFYREQLVRLLPAGFSGEADVLAGDWYMEIRK